MKDEIVDSSSTTVLTVQQFDQLKSLKKYLHKDGKRQNIKAWVSIM